jgi:uncharacterized protein YegP (UPF0339 family)
VETTNYIIKSQKSIPAEDYSFLRREGIKYIEKLAGKIWTDYNTHDPGITILELLCYAITDLGYRSSYHIKDILATGNFSEDKWKYQFHTAAQIFPCNPVTVPDYRKLLADLPGIKNAWLVVVAENEVAFYADRVKNELTYIQPKGEARVQLEGLYKILVEFEDGISENKKKVIKPDVLNLLHRHRNLCEDFLSVDEVKNEDISVCADIEVSRDTDVDEVLAEIYFRIENYFSPPINFYTINELLDKGKSIEEIFEGPLLNHGFIDSDELERANLMSELHTSDIYNFIMDIPGVIAVKNLLLTSYVNGNPYQINQPWILKLSGENLAPKLFLEKSKIIFYKDILPFIADEETVSRKLNERKDVNKKFRLKGHQTDLTVPEGTVMDIEDYYPLQNEFPLCYGIGEVGLPDSASYKRKAQAKQLKAYLLFYEQIFANYLSQLAHTKELFSFDENVKQTYFVKLLEDIDGLEELFIDYSNYGNSLYGLVESEKLFLERRNRFLNHLLARFAEELVEYGNLLVMMKGNAAYPELIKNKTDILMEYPVLSSERGKAFNYRDKNEIWDTENVAGMKKRISRQLGFTSYERYNLATLFIKIVKVSAVPEDKFKIVIYDPADGTTVLLETKEYPDYECAESILHYILAHGDNEENYSKSVNASGKYLFSFLNDCEEVIATSRKYDRAAERDEALKYLLEFFKKYCDIEGMHIVEHLLLRPQSKKNKLLPVCLEAATEVEGGELQEFYFEIFLDVSRKPFRKREWRFRLKDKTGDIIFKSESYKALQGCKKGIASVRVNGGDFSNYRVLKSVNNRYYFNLVAANGEIIGTTSDLYKTEKSAIDKVYELISFFKGKSILPPEVFSTCGIAEDPYSFRISVILPSWPEKFRNLNFRRYVEKTIRLETPAHIYPRICWIDLNQMIEFEAAYKKYLQGIHGSKTERTESTNKFIDVLFNLRNVYPAAKLHDCESAGSSAPQVVLDYSTLGII